MRASRIYLPRPARMPTRGVLTNASSILTGLDFPSNVSGSDQAAPFVAMQYLNPHNNGLPIWGTGAGSARTGATYIWKIRPRQQTGYHATMWWSNNGSFLWDGGSANTYCGGHPYPQNQANTGTTHWWEIATDYGGDYIDYLGNSPGSGSPKTVVKDVWFTQALRIIVNGDNSKTLRFYNALPSVATADYVEHTVPSGYGETNPPSPALTFGDSPWYATYQHERLSGVLRGIKVFARGLSEAEVLTEASTDTISAANIWYANPNPTPDDITDKSGQGHNFTWADGANKATLWTG